MCDENGCVIGVAKSGLDNAQNVNFAVPINMAFDYFGVGLDPSPSWDKRPMTAADIERYESEPRSTALNSSPSPKASKNNGQSVDTVLFKREIHSLFPGATIIYTTATEAKIKLGDNQASYTDLNRQQRLSRISACSEQPVGR